MAGVFVSYRRSGASVVTYRLVDDMQRTFGEERVFLDQESIDPGLPFDEAIQNALEQCSVALIIIGPQWASMTDKQGGRRLDAPGDWVRQEIELAMSANVRVIPVLVQGADMPESEELPESIRGFAALQAFAISASQAHWQFDVGRLIEKLQRIDPELLPPDKSGPEPEKDPHKPPTGPTYSRKVLGALGIWLVVGVVAVTEGFYDTEELLGAVTLLVGGAVLAIWGWRDIHSGKATGRIGAIAAASLCILAALGNIIGFMPGNDDYAATPVWTEPTAPPPISKGPLKGSGFDANYQQEPDPGQFESRQAAVPQLTGMWQTPEGISYQMMQSGNQIQFIEYNSFGVQVGQGSGTVNGDTLTFSYFNNMLGMNANGTGRVTGGVLQLTLVEPMSGQSTSLVAYRQ